MATQVLQEFEVESSKVFRLGDILPGPAWAAYSPEAPALPSDEWISEKTTVDRGCLRGLMIGFAAEAVMALGVYAVWQVWHILR
jgi:hypothetical protein